MVALLGKGGMGEVYRAEDLKLGQTVALKFLPASVAHSEAARARFHREVRLARQVSHPNVCRVFDIGEAGGRTFITMEYVDGEDLPLSRGTSLAGTQAGERPPCWSCWPWPCMVSALRLAEAPCSGQLSKIKASFTSAKKGPRAFRRGGSDTLACS